MPEFDPAASGPSIPSRPHGAETAVVCALIIGTGAWLMAGVNDAQAELLARAASIEELRRGATDTDSGERWKAREQLVDAHLDIAREFVAAATDAVDSDPSIEPLTSTDPVALLEAVEALIASRSGDDPTVRRVLAAVRSALDALEQEAGFLDPDLEATRDLLIEHLPGEPNPFRQLETE